MYRGVNFLVVGPRCWREIRIFVADGVVMMTDLEECDGLGAACRHDKGVLCIANGGVDVDDHEHHHRHAEELGHFPVDARSASIACLKCCVSEPRHKPHRQVCG